MATAILGSLDPSGVAEAPKCFPPPQDLIGWWRGEADALDFVNAHHGSLKGGPGFFIGRVGAAFSLNGSTDFIEVLDHDAWAFGKNDFSIEFWVSFRGLSASTDVARPAAVFVASDEGPGNVNKWFFSLGGGSLCFLVNSPSENVTMFLVRAPFAPTLNQWYHLVLVRGGNVFTVYRDGVVIGTETAAVSVPNAKAPLTIGQAEGGVFLNARPAASFWTGRRR
ncbi:MAG: LamG domain-containing protein [Verrucomicrobia bacterium]|nr:LamG domain-containing protein [Verrucomicrobiota bacterium]